MAFDSNGVVYLVKNYAQSRSRPDLNFPALFEKVKIKTKQKNREEIA